jgi:phosphate/sulfate permease
MIIWAIWIVLWLSVFWSRLIKTVWWEITKLNQSSAFCVALSAAITVIIASQLWLPVSSTHIALGWIFWVGLYRQHLKRLKWKEKDYIRTDMIRNIALSWFITLPISWWISAITYLSISYFY